MVKFNRKFNRKSKQGKNLFAFKISAASSVSARIVNNFFLQTPSSMSLQCNNRYKLKLKFAVKYLTESRNIRKYLEFRVKIWGQINLKSPKVSGTGRSDPPEKIFHICASENEVYTIY